MYQILLVDDEPIVKIALRSIIPWEQFGYMICGTAANGEEALQLVLKHNPDVIITDLKMPVMDGIELIRILKNRGYDGEIIVLSNYEDFESVRSALVLGASDYLLKVSIDATAIEQQLTKMNTKLIKRQKQASAASSQEADLNRQKENKINLLKEYLTQDTKTGQYINSQSEAAFLQEELQTSLCYVSFENCIADKQGELSKNIMNNMMIEALQEYPDSLWFTMDYYNYILLLPVKEFPEKEKVRQLASKLYTRFQTFQSLTPAILFDWNLSGYDQLPLAYRSMQEVLLLQFYGALAVEDAKELYPLHYMSFIHYKDFAEEIHHNHTSKLEESQNRIKEIIADCNELHIYPEIVRKFFIKVLEHIEFLSKEINLQTHEYLVEMKEFLRFCRDSKELIAYMELSLQAVYSPQELREVDVARYKNEISLAMKYIEDNYQQRITLASIAEHVNFSTNYLCKTFKAKTGTNIISYINNLRMKKAGEMLKQKDSLVKEVAISVGIDDQLYFSKLFKKHYGISPTEYKSKYL